MLRHRHSILQGTVFKGNTNAEKILEIDTHIVIPLKRLLDVTMRIGKDDIYPAASQKIQLNGAVTKILHGERLFCITYSLCYFSITLIKDNFLVMSMHFL